MSKTKTRVTIGFIVLFVLLIVMLLLNLYVGSVSIRPSDIFDVLFKAGGDETSTAILLKIRLPRLLAAALLGGALSVSGYLLQTFFANPIAGPYVLGISSGAKLVVAAVMILSLSRGFILNSAIMVLAAFVGSLISMAFVLFISTKVKRMSILIICGVMIGYICTAVTDFIVTFADDSNIVNLRNWSLGSFSGTNWSNVAVMSVIVLVSLVLAFLLSKPISAYQLGENYAKNSGVNIRLFRVALILLSSLLSGCVTAFAGPISFVGIAVPHLVKTSFKSSKPVVVIPACFLGGATFCLLCDLIARALFAPTELSISSVTAVFGAPVVIWMLVRRKREQ